MLSHEWTECILCVREWWRKIAMVPGLENYLVTYKQARRLTTPFIYGVVNFKKVKSKVNSYQ